MKGRLEIVCRDRGEAAWTEAAWTVEARVSDGEDTVTVALPRDEWTRAAFEGRRSVLDLISDHAPPAVERMMRRALAEGHPILLDGHEIDHTSVALAFFIDHEPGRPRP